MDDASALLGASFADSFKIEGTRSGECFGFISSQSEHLIIASY